MDEKVLQDNGIIIGIDVEPENVQITWYSSALCEPETVGTQVGVDKFKIPLCIFCGKQEGSFLIGEAAARAAENQEEGVFVPDLWNGSLLRKKRNIYERDWSYSELLQIYFSRLVHMVENIANTKQIQSIAVTSQTMDKEIVELLKSALHEFEEQGVILYFKSYKESFLAYYMNQSTDLFVHDAVLFYFGRQQLYVYHLSMNRHFVPYRVQIQEELIEEFSGVGSIASYNEEEKISLDRHFAQMAKKLFGRVLISSVFLTGDGFDKEWMDETLRFLCHGRRVFQGKNLFTKGACYYAMEKAGLVKCQYDYPGEQSMDYIIRMNVWDKGENQTIYISDGKADWYNIEKELTVLLDDCSEITVEIFKEKHFQERQLVVLSLDDLPKRANLSVKIKINMRMQERNIFVINAKDMGFGEFFESSGLQWEKKVTLEG